MAKRQSQILPFDEAIQFFRGKLNLESASWTETYGREHDHAFVVAGANKRDLVEDFRQAIDQAVAQRTGYDEFRKQFAHIVKKHGWSYNGGEGWRSRVIYQTNLRQAYNAGRFAQMKKIAHRRPYWQYHHSPLVREPRLDHQSWNGLVLHHENPWWETHFPANGWGCQCWVTSHREKDLAKLGKTGPDNAPALEKEWTLVGARGPHARSVHVPKGIDPGFEHTPGRSWLDAMTPRLSDEPPVIVPRHRRALQQAETELPDLPEPTAPVPEALPGDWTDADYLRQFKDDLGGDGRSAFVFRDAAGEYLPISDALFDAPDGRSGLRSDDRHRRLPQLAAILKSPDEIWLDWQDSPTGSLLRRRYIKRFVDDSTGGRIGVIDLNRLGWRDLVEPGIDADDLRQGVMIYRRGDDA